MDRARAMYLGGKEIYADDKYLNYYSYKELGLRCSVCGEPVHLKKGLNKKPHFAHFPSTDSKQVEECELRLSSYKESTQKSLGNFSVNRGQNLEVFQIYLISLIASKNYSNAIKIVKDSIGNVDFLEELAKEFQSNLFLFKKKIPTLQLQERVTLEVIDYLCVESSSSLLKELIGYSLYQVYNSSSYECDYWIQKNNYPVIFSKLIETLINTPWLEVLHFTYKENINNNTPISGNFPAKLEKLPLAGHNSTAYCPFGRKKEVSKMSLFRAFHAVPFKMNKQEGCLIVLRDQKKEHRGIVWFLEGSIPSVICDGGKEAYDFMMEKAQQVAFLSVARGEAIIKPALVATKVEKVEEKDEKGEIVTKEIKKEIEVMVPGSFLNSKVEKACHKLFNGIDIIEQTRYCSLEKILALEVSASIKDKVTGDLADKPEKIEEIRKTAISQASNNVRKQLTSAQRDMLQKRLGTNGIVLKMIEAE